MVMDPSCKISLCIFSFILFWIYCLDFYHIYVHIKAQLFIVKANLQSMSFSVFCLPRLVVWSCSLTSIRAWLTLSPGSPGSPFYKEAVCPWPWPSCTMKRARDMDSYMLWGKIGDIYLCSFWGRAKCHPFKSPWPPVKGSWRTGAGKQWKEKCREAEDGRRSLANASERDQAVASQALSRRELGVGSVHLRVRGTAGLLWAVLFHPGKSLWLKGTRSPSELSGQRTVRVGKFS